MGWEDETQAFFHTLRTGNVLKTRTKTVTCATCNGTGKHCDGCTGIGSLFKSCTHCNNGGTRVPCSTCNGTPPMCRVCFGEGKVRRSFVPKNHPADKYTIAALRKISVNGSFT